MTEKQRRFASTDPDYPTTPALTAALRSRGALAAAAPPPGRPAPPAGCPPSPDATDQAPGGADGMIIGDNGREPLVLDLAKLLAGRLLIQGSSGAGKSMTLRRVVEQAFRAITTILVDPEGEFENLAGHIGATTVRGSELAGDGLTAIALKCREHRLPLHLDLSDLEPDTRIAKAAAFFTGLLAAPREHWKHTCLVAIDEAHLLAPHIAASARDAETRRLGVATLTELCSRGRKRGIAPIIATQRLAKLAASVLSELHNFLLGLNVLDRDVARAADILGWANDKAGILRDLAPGKFVAHGPALFRFPTIIAVREAVTLHTGATPELLGAAAIDGDAAAALLELDRLCVREQPIGASTWKGRPPHALDAFLLEPAAATAARLVPVLASISPNATTAAELEKHLVVPAEEIHAGLDLLASAGIVETIPKSEGRIARLSARLRTKLTATPVVGLA